MNFNLFDSIWNEYLCWQIEDLNEDTISARHDRCEVEEKKKFMSYIKLPHTGRARAHRRTDSRAESSGANTPGELSQQG